MRYLDYREKRVHGSADFPVAYYFVDAKHPRYNMVDHWHMECELIRVKRGTLRLSLNGRTHEGRAGEVFFVHEGTLHGGIPLSCEYECLVFDMHRLLEPNAACQKSLLPILQGSRAICPRFDENDQAVLCAVNEAMEAASSGGPGHELILLGALYRFAGLCVQNYLDEPHCNALRLARFKETLRLIRNRYQENLNLDALAAAAHMSKPYFCRYFREMTSKTPMEYLNYYRVECASEQLKTTGQSVSEIGLSCGFNDISYFIRVFKKFKGVTPSRYAKEKL